MKKFIFALATAFAAICGMSAQSADITIGYGGYTQMDATNCHDDWHHDFSLLFRIFAPLCNRSSNAHFS